MAALDPERAEPVLREALEAAMGSGSVSVMSVAGEELYQLLLRRRRIDEAVPVLRDVLAWRTRLHGRDTEAAAAWRNELILRLAQLGRYAEAEQLCRDRLDSARRRRPPDARAVGFALVTLAWCVRSLGRWDEAERLSREAVEILDAGPVPHGSVGWALAGLAAVLLRRMDLEAAEAALKRAASEWAIVGRSDLADGIEEQLMDVYLVGERHSEALAVSEAALTGRGEARRSWRTASDSSATWTATPSCSELAEEDPTLPATSCAPATSVRRSRPSREPATEQAWTPPDRSSRASRCWTGRSQAWQ